MFQTNRVCYIRISQWECYLLFVIGRLVLGRGFWSFLGCNVENLLTLFGLYLSAMRKKFSVVSCRRSRPTSDGASFFTGCRSKANHIRQCLRAFLHLKSIYWTCETFFGQQQIEQNNKIFKIEVNFWVINWLPKLQESNC